MARSASQWLEVARSGVEVARSVSQFLWLKLSYSWVEVVEVARSGWQCSQWLAVARSGFEVARSGSQWLAVAVARSGLAVARK